MQLDPATLLMAKESAPPIAAEVTDDTAPVADIFAALLSALAPANTPAAPLEAATTGGTEAGEGEKAPGQAASPGMPQAAPEALDASLQPMVAGEAAVAGLVEVARGARGLPLAPPADAAAATEDETPALPIGAASTDSRPTAPPTVNVDTPAMDAPPAMVRPTRTGSGQEAPSLTTTQHEVEPGEGDGRPVRVMPTTTDEPGAKPGAADVIEKPAGDVAAPATDPSTESTTVAADAPEDQALETAPAPASPGPRPVAWQPEPGATVATPVTPLGAGDDPASLMPSPIEPAAPPTDSAPAATSRPAEPPPVQAQVLRQLGDRLAGADSKPQQITLQLEPEHLGKVEVRLIARGDQLQVEIQAETAEAGLALREGRHELVRSLTAQAGRWQHVEVKIVDSEQSAPEAEDQEEERSEHGSRRERDRHQHRRQRGEG